MRRERPHPGLPDWTLLDGPEVVLAEVDGLPLEGYLAFHAIRAELLRRLGRSEPNPFG